MSNFIEEIIDSEINSAKIITRFPPEPNGYLHNSFSKRWLDGPSWTKYWKIRIYQIMNGA